jgi:oxygen-dependent protoporphyrinogen oxidase
VASAPLTLVIGAGISGLSCAYALKKSGQNVVVLEAGARPGGVIQSSEERGYLVELGPQSFGATGAFGDLLQELGLNDQVLEAPAAAARYVWTGERLVSVPMTLPAFLASDLLSWKSKCRVFFEPFGTTCPPEGDESVAAFTRRKFSDELFERLVDPFVSGIYAGDAEQISLRAAFPKVYEAEKSTGSVMRGMIKLRQKSGAGRAVSSRRRSRLITFRSGNETLVRALADRLGRALCCHTAVEKIAKAGDGYLAEARRNGASEQISCARLVIATPAGTAAGLLEGLAPEVSVSLAGIAYAPLAVVSLGYRREQIPHGLAGFGFLAPRSSGLRALGTVWNSSLFPDRAPQGQVLLTTFVGGASDPSIVALSPQELSEIVRRDLATVLGVTGPPAMQRVTQYTQAIPQYNLGHTERLEKARHALRAVPGLWVVGNYWKGPAVGACFENSLAVAEQVRISYNSFEAEA